jgi:hypothetical protein
VSLKGDEMIRVCICTLIALVFPTIGAAQSPINGVGVFFDQNSQVNCLTSGLDSLMTAYLVLFEPSDVSGVGGWQGRLTSDVGVSVFNVILSGQGVLNIGSGDDYIVGLGVPLPWDDMILLASFSVYASAPGGIYFDSLSNGELPAYIGGEPEPVLTTMWLMYGSGAEPSASICMPECPTANAVPPLVGGSVWDFGAERPSTATGCTWGGVKALYRQGQG